MSGRRFAETRTHPILGTETRERGSLPASGRQARRARKAAARRAARKPGPIVPLIAYQRLEYECLRCKTTFVSTRGPEIFCESCRRTLDEAGQRQSAENQGSEEK